MKEPTKPPSASQVLASGSGRRDGAPARRRAWRLVASIAAGVLAGCGGEQKPAGGGGGGAGARRPAAPPGGAGAPAATGKASAQEPGGGAERAVEPAQSPARQSDRPDWWMDQAVVTEGSYVGTFEATAPSLRQARQTALDNAHVAVRTSLGRDPVKFEVQPTWSARRADGSYRVCVKVAAEAGKAP